MAGGYYEGSPQMRMGTPTFAPPAPLVDISEVGEVSIRLDGRQPEECFGLVLNAVKFLGALFPKYSYPSLVAGVANQVDATYKIESWENKILDDLDGAEQTARLRRIKTIKVADIRDVPGYKRVEYEVESTMESEFFTETFPPTTWLSVEIEHNQVTGGSRITIMMNGGPPRIKSATCCLCIPLAAVIASREEAEIMKTDIQKQANSVASYFANAMDDSVSQMGSKMTLRPKLPSQLSNGPGRFGSQIGGSKRGVPSPYRSPRQSPPPPGSLYSKGGAPSGKVSFTGNESSVSAGLGRVAPNSTKADELKKLFELFQYGALSRKEFERMKRELVSGQRTTVPTNF